GRGSHGLVAVGRLLDGIAYLKSKAVGQPIESKIDDRRGVKREELAQDKSANDGDSEGAPQFGADAGAESQGQGAEEGGHGRHHDGTETQQAGFVDGVERRLPF